MFMRLFWAVWFRLVLNVTVLRAMRHVTAPRKAVCVGSDWGYLDSESSDNLVSRVGFIESLFDLFGRFGFVC